jgi:hypothetical protein
VTKPFLQDLSIPFVSLWDSVGCFIKVVNINFNFFFVVRTISCLFLSFEGLEFSFKIFKILAEGFFFLRIQLN